MISVSVLDPGFPKPKGVRQLVNFSWKLHENEKNGPGGDVSLAAP